MKEFRNQQVKLTFNYFVNSALTVIDEKRIIGHLITGFLRKVDSSDFFTKKLVSFYYQLAKKRKIEL